MPNDVVIEPMKKGFMLWRCLHGGPLSAVTIDQCKPGEEAHWSSLRKRNVPLLVKLTEAYGACALVARDGEQIVGTLRFYPKALWSAAEPGSFCLQGFPPGARDLLADVTLPSLDELEDKTLRVHCLMAGSPFQEQNPHLRKGIGSRLVRALIAWAQENGWEGIEATAVEDLGVLYEHTGMAGKSFWDKLGFRAIDVLRGPRGGLPGDVLELVRKEAVAKGLSPDIAETYAMRLDRSDPAWI